MYFFSFFFGAAPARIKSWPPIRRRCDPTWGFGFVIRLVTVATFMGRGKPLPNLHSGAPSLFFKAYPLLLLLLEDFCCSRKRGGAAISLVTSKLSLRLRYFTEYFLIRSPINVSQNIPERYTTTGRVTLIFACESVIDNGGYYEGTAWCYWGLTVAGVTGAHRRK